jgi:AmmeMemoRadiSam system protein B
MPEPLPRLRSDLDFMPSPVEDHPGLLIRDSMGYSDSVLIIPPVLVECLSYFDGERTSLDLRQSLVNLTGDLQVGQLESNLVSALTRSGFLEEETFERLKEDRHRVFAESPVREPSHAGTAYPEGPVELRPTMNKWMGHDRAPVPGGAQQAPGRLIGIAAPHVSPQGGYESYRAAYRLLTPDYQDRTFVVLGTSHYGASEKFGLTRKPYRTPWGDTRTDMALLEELTRKAKDAVTSEDYCHSVEHSIEFQVIFLQWLFGPEIKILPILCGSYAHSIYLGGKPEADEGVNRFLGTLGEIAAREEDRLFWVLGIDMAHMGNRYGDSFTAVANRDEMEAVATRDLQRIDRVNANDVDGYWDLVQQNRDDLKWCGSSPLYTFLKARPQSRGGIENYEQWNIDEESVVTFAGLSFR